MVARLALRNIGRHVRDYAIYVVTLVFGVAVFFALNSISDQRVMFDLLDNAAGQIFDTTEFFMGMFSVVVACVLGFLVIYANRFLIRRRKREFGIYLTLGMGPAGVSRIVLIETLAVGLGALAIGLVLGIGLAQGLSFATAALFGTTITHYEFIFSLRALMWTLASFAVIFGVVALFNTFTASRLKLIDLLCASKRNERTPVRNPVVCALGFVASLIVLNRAYTTLIHNGLVTFDGEFWLATVLMLVGTLLLFWSLAGFAIAVLTRLRGVYLRGLVPFTVRQVASKVNTAFLSLWAVSVLLFFAITVFSTGMGLVEVFTGDIEKASPYDVTFLTSYAPAEYPEGTAADADDAALRSEAMRRENPGLHAEAQAFDWNPLALMRQRVEGWDAMVRDAACARVWPIPGLPYKELPALFDRAGHPLDESDRSQFASVVTNVQVVGLSDYNSLLALQGKPALELAPGCYAIANNVAGIDSVASALLHNEMALEFIEGQPLVPQGPVDASQIGDSSMLSTVLIFIVPDTVIQSLEGNGAIPQYACTDVNLVDATPQGEQTFKRTVYESLKAPAWPAYDATLGQGHSEDGVGYYDGSLNSLWPVSSTVLGSEMKAQAGGLRMLITYLALYIGFVLLIATAAILAIQQLSETADSEARYGLLRALGCDNRMLARSLFAQVLLYFAAPLVVACCHAAQAIGVLAGNLFDSYGIAALGSIGWSAALVVGVYGMYFVVTYLVGRALLLRGWAREKGL